MRERIIRIVAGLMVLLGLLMTYLTANNSWLWIDVFVGLNLFQSGITKWCLMDDILKKLKV